MIKIAVGCGKRQYSGYIHIDGDTSFKHLDDTDIWLKKWDNETIDVIYSCHLLNYFSHKEAPILLKVWFDKLKNGGILRLAVPDFGVMAELYEDNRIQLEDIRGPLSGKWEMNGVEIFHKSFWDWSTLADELESIGFETVRKYNWKSVDTANVDDHAKAFLAPKGDQVNGTLISLNIEAIK